MAVCLPSQTFPTLDLTCTNCGALGALDLSLSRSLSCSGGIFVLVGGETNLGGKVQGEWRVGCKDVTFHDVQTTFRTQMAGEGKECSGGRFLNWRGGSGGLERGGGLL